MPDAPHKTRRRRRWLRRIGLAVAVLAVASIAADIWVLPPVVRGLIRRALRDAGIDQVSFDLEYVYPGHMDITGVKLGSPGWLTADMVRVSYDFGTLWHGRVSRVEFRRPEWSVRVDQGKVDWGFPAGASPAAAGPIDLNVDTIALTDGVVHLDLNGELQHVAVAGTISHPAPGKFEMAIQSEAPKLRSLGLELEAKALTLAGVVDAGAPGRPTLVAKVRLSEARFAESSGSVAVRGVNLLLPVQYNAGSPPPGELSAEAAVIDGVAMPGFTGDVRLTDGRLEGGITWPVVAGAVLSANGYFDLVSRQGELTASVPEFDLKSPEVLEHWVPALAGAEFSGRFSLDAHAVYGEGKFQPLIRVSGDDIATSKKDWPGSIGSGSASLTINSLSPLATPAGQQVYIEKARLGDIDIADCLLRFTITNPHSVLIQSAAWSMGGYGVFHADDQMRFDPSDPEFHATVLCEQVGLGSWLPLLSRGHISGEGLLQGRIAINYKPGAQVPLQVDIGYLGAMQAAGWIKTADTELVESLLQESTAGDIAIGNVKQRIINSLKDFAYSDFEVQFETEDGEMMTRISTQGRGRAGLDSQEIGGLTLNVRNFNDLLNLVMKLKPAFDRME